MENIKISGLKRNPDVIKSYFKVIGESTVVKEDIKIIFPVRYINRNLAIFGNSVKTVSIYAIVDENNNYAVCIAPIYQEVSPYNISDVLIDGVVYKCLEFKANDVVISNNNLVMNDSFLYDLFDEFFIKGNIPWFLDYDDVNDLLLETKKYAGSNIGKNPLAFEILTSIIARDPNDKKQFFRKLDNTKKKPTYVGLNNIYYSYTTTGARLVGGYYGPGVTAAVVDKEEEASYIEKILKY